MAEKLSRDTSIRRQLKSASIKSENHNSPHQHTSSSRGENRDTRDQIRSRREIQNHKAGNTYPPLEDYAE